MNTSKETRTRSRMRFLWIELLIRIAFIVIGGYLIFTKVFLIGQVSGMDMFPALKDGDAYAAFCLQEDYERGDVIVYELDGKRRVGRIVAVTNDTVEIGQDGVLRVNGTAEDAEITFATYPLSEEAINCPVSSDCFYVLGDYRTQAEDSRVLGEIHRSEICGKIITILRRQSL